MPKTRIIYGDALESLKGLPDGSVQCCVTSPPYYGLRDYGGLEGQVGRETDLETYIANLVAVFREVRRALADDGTLWLNLGDAYAKDKNRLIMPARVALALQTDGWWVRDEIVWHKPRTTPFPANDRTVAAHEMVYLLAKQPRYFFDWEAIEEPSKYPGVVRQKGKAFRLHGHDKAAALATADKTNAYGGKGGETITVRDTRRARAACGRSLRSLTRKRTSPRCRPLSPRSASKPEAASATPCSIRSAAQAQRLWRPMRSGATPC